ncbi:lipoprotein NlpI [Motilimonas cestriensis]|uniref:Lipoprotein NlpI n=1 Tax=Motilimonas cestriensis TaxID=2742685 RepID=A0ABS8W449_9GAMM|nr:lipoprotein NlpI [Motilimonas cestriensis]MCE2593731.1 lipoprotein NlpI [Motilimonas cestriensis]
MKKVLLALLAASAMLTGCANNNASERGSQSLVLAIPLQVTYQSELKLIRLGQMINSPDVDSEKLAVLFYERGATYDQLGMTSLARFDFNQAIKVKPDFAEAYNYLGVYLTQMQEFDESFEAFDSVLELQPDHQYAYMNRGIALSYAGAHELAVADLKTFVSFEPAEPYRNIWLYLAEQHVSPEAAMARLKANQAKYQTADWGWRIADFYTGKIDEATYISSLSQGIENNQSLAERLCEAYFYLGKWYQAQGNDVLAASFYKLSLSNNVYEFIEHKYALLELDLLALKHNPNR